MTTGNWQHSARTKAIFSIRLFCCLFFGAATRRDRCEGDHAARFSMTVARETKANPPPKKKKIKENKKERVRRVSTADHQADYCTAGASPDSCIEVRFTSSRRCFSLVFFSLFSFFLRSSCDQRVRRGHSIRPVGPDWLRTD